MIATADYPANPIEVDLKHLVVKATDIDSATEIQRGLWVKNARGEVEHDYFFMDDTPLENGQSRILLTLENMIDPARGSMPTIAENYYHSPRHRAIRRHCPAIPAKF